MYDPLGETRNENLCIGCDELKEECVCVYKFTIEPKYLTSVVVAYEYTRNGHKYGTMSYVDHPSFTALREHLGANGFIEIQRQWLNGDRVTKRFELNGFKYEVGDKFSTAGAQGCSLRCRDNTIDFGGKIDV